MVWRGVALWFLAITADQVATLFSFDRLRFIGIELLRLNLSEEPFRIDSPSRVHRGSRKIPGRML
jgi:hypothetical protein